MLRSMKDLEGYAIEATDGTIGQVKDFYFDDDSWVIRYLVVDTGSWLSGRNVLISPIAIGHPKWLERTLPVSITKEQVKRSPDIDTEKPVSRQHEMEYSGYFGYPYYWGGSGLWDGGLYPGMLLPGYAGFGSPDAARSKEDNAYAQVEATRHQDDDPHLRSCKAVMGYHVHATDGDIGHVQSLLIDDKSWAIRYLVANTSNWWVGHDVLISPQWIKDVSWSDSKVSVHLTRQAIKDCPPYDSAVQLDRQREIDVHKHYGRPGYWSDDAKSETEISRD